jgi:hypothetical protein
MAITWFGGTDTSWAESGGLALGAVTGNVYTDLSKATQLTDLRDKDGNTVTTVVTMVNGHYYFGVNNHPGNVVVDFGAGPYIVYPSDLGDRLATVESLVAALRATPTTGRPPPSTPPVSTSPPPTAPAATSTPATPPAPASAARTPPPPSRPPRPPPVSPRPPRPACSPR